MTNGLGHAVLIMVVVIVVSIFIMMLFPVMLEVFVSKHHSLQVLGMTFLLLIGIMLVTEAAHLSHTQFLNREICSIQKDICILLLLFLWS